jgi:hypothetical protein
LGCGGWCVGVQLNAKVKRKSCDLMDGDNVCVVRLNVCVDVGYVCVYSGCQNSYR